MTALIRRLDQWLSANRPEFYRSLLPGIGPAGVRACEALLGFPMPDALIALYAWRNGQSNTSSDFCGACYADCYTPYTFMTLRQVQESHASLNEIWRELEDTGAPGRDTWWHPRWVPFLDGAGDHLCVDAVGTLGGRQGQVLSFLHDDSTRLIDYPSLERWLETFVVSLEASLWEERNGRFQPVDNSKVEAVVNKMNPGYPIRVRSTLSG